MWHLEKILKVGDRVEAHSMRTYKVGTKEEKKAVTVQLKIENVEFAKHSNRLRILGPIIGGEPEEFIQLGRYHTIDVAEGEKIKIAKEWKRYEINRLKEAEKESKKPKLRIIVLDEEKALTAIIRSYGVDYGPEFYSNKSKRDEKADKTEISYFDEIANEIERHKEKYIVAGPGFTKDNFKKFLNNKKPDLLKRIIFESVSYAERNGVNELFGNGIVEKVIGEERLQKEAKAIEDFLISVHKDTGFATYGIKEVKAATEASAVDRLFVLDEYLRNDKTAEEIVEKAETSGTKVVIFSSEGEPGQRLKGFGKIAALLRFKL
jgi:protein pelota